jgi:hypothetical protein
MIRRLKQNWIYIAGCLSLSGGISLQQFSHGGIPEFAAGATMGISIGLLILSQRKPTACSPN